MKDLGSDKKPLFFDDYDAQSPQIRESSPNADIQYLLTHISIKQGQELNLTQKSLKQQNNPGTIPSQALFQFIAKNTDAETAIPSQRETIVSLIDSGIQIISKIKSLMNKKKLDQQKSKFPVNPLEFLRELLFGKSSSEDNTREEDRKKSTDKQMKILMLESEIKMLLAVASQRDEAKQNGKSSVQKFRFLLTQSLYERVVESSNSQASKSQIYKKITSLDEKLARLQDFSSNNSNFNEELPKYEQKMTDIWTQIGDFSQYLNNETFK